MQILNNFKRNTVDLAHAIRVRWRATKHTQHALPVASRNKTKRIYVYYVKGFN